MVSKSNYKLHYQIIDFPLFFYKLSIILRNQCLIRSLVIGTFFTRIINVKGFIVGRMLVFMDEI